MNGMSNSAVGPMPDRKPRIWSRSRIGCRLSAGRAPLQRQRRHQLEDARRDQLVEARADAGQHLGAQRVEAALQKIGRQHDQREADQGRDAAARQHPVVDLQHVERAGQHQHVDHRREQPHPDKRRPAARQRPPSSDPAGQTRLRLLSFIVICAPHDPLGESKCPAGSSERSRIRSLRSPRNRPCMTTRNRSRSHADRSARGDGRC